MSSRVLKADPRNAQFAMRFPSVPDPDDPSKMLPEVVLPAGRAYSSQRANGASNFIELNDDQQRRLAVDPVFMSMIATHGRKGAAYHWTEYTEIPAFALPQATINIRLQQENARLRAELRKHDVPLPSTVNAEAPEVKPEDQEEELHPGEVVMIDKAPVPGSKSKARKVPRGGMKIGGQSENDILGGLPS
jgi:hypothetical protein